MYDALELQMTSHLHSILATRNLLSIIIKCTTATPLGRTSSQDCQH